MVSLTQRQELAIAVAADPQLQRLQLLLDGSTLPISGVAELGIREQLLDAISTNKADNFRNITDGIAQRKISPDSDWCQDDYLVFLLLLGQEKFNHRLSFLMSVIDVRMLNGNPIPRRINEVFSAIARQEFEIEGELGFLKIPFLYLVGKLRIGPKEAKKTLAALSSPGLIEKLSPFFQLLTQKAHDLVLTDRQPSIFETNAQLVEMVAKQAKEFSLRDWGKVFISLPPRFLWGLVALIAGAGLIPMLLGVGKGLIDSHLNTIDRQRPSELTIAFAHAPGPELPPEAIILAKSLQQPTNAPNLKSQLVVVETHAFSSATPSFVVEALHLDHPIRAVFAYTKTKLNSDRSFTVIPVAKDSGRIRAMVPERGAGTTLCFVFEFETNAADTLESIASRIVLRPLD